MATIYARLIDEYKFKYLIVVLPSFYKTNGADQKSDEIEFFISLNINHILAESNFNGIDVKSQLEHRIQIKETKESDWIFNKINSMKMSFFETCELNGSSYVEIP